MQFLPLDHSQRACISSHFLSSHVLRIVTGSPGGNPFSSIDAQTKSRLHRLDSKGSTLARITSAKGRWQWHPLLALRKAFISWRIWCGYLQLEAVHCNDVLILKLGIQPLRDLALADVKSKVTFDNIEDEVFLWANG